LIGHERGDFFVRNNLLHRVTLLSFLTLAAAVSSAAIAETSDAVNECQSKLARQVEVLHDVGFSDQEIRDRLAKNPNEKIRIPREVWLWRSELARQIAELYDAGFSDQEIRNWLVKYPNEQISQEVLDGFAKHPIRKNRSHCIVRLV
jgi:hypothetical protein